MYETSVLRLLDLNVASEYEWYLPLLLSTKILIPDSALASRCDLAFSITHVWLLLDGVLLRHWHLESLDFQCFIIRVGSVDIVHFSVEQVLTQFGSAVHSSILAPAPVEA